ncbi:hypothetical protein M758_10G061800 [Ceratodon purpureus]|nr:hypothetical protein M758_10G061800 [Ceratodon purpureus]
MYTHTVTLAPPSVAHRAHQHPRLAPRDRPSSGITISCSRGRTRYATQPRLEELSWSESEPLPFRMSEPGRRNSLSSRFSRKFSISSRRGDGKVEGKLEDAVENVEQDESGPSQLTVGASNPEHVVFLVNGIWGSVKNWIFAVKVLKKQLGDKVVIHCSSANGGLKTHAGVDVMGERLAKEVMEVIEKNPGVTKISFVGHSLGGLISRYAIGLLYAPPGGRMLLQMGEKSSTSDSEAGASGRDHTGAPLKTTIEGLEQDTIAGLIPVNFITLATPHLGCRGNNHLPFLFGRAVLEWAAPLVSPLIIGPTGKHLFLADGNKNRQPLLERMVKDCEEGKFLSALRCFKRRVAYANVCHDRMVGWRTASIRKASEMPEPLEEPEESQKERLKGYKYIVREEDAPLADKNSSEPKDVAALDDIEEVMVAGLQQVPWHRVDVNFSKNDTLYEAHNLIQVKNESWHSQGESVIRHVIDNYFIKGEE